MKTKKRPKKNEKARTWHTVPVRVNAEEYEELKELARIYAGGNISEWMRMRALGTTEGWP
jgi:hypothetical protein